ncbi:putative amidophosphoribosyltransferase [Desulfomicrobium macestii]|uniref:Amidophosphoribosyltransferase n=1 Tax=Desulfomicrobium macestii TaxID=90731 RepID=A0ABR9H9E5_9BACT|nr:hypothetical protein [Desulfomicrobium macestii]MBE1427358.1 putative amidophosphoribosyltransferase [Desulfomicrobium macestii]
MNLTITFVAFTAGAVVAAVGLKMRLSQRPTVCPSCKARHGYSASTCTVCGAVMNSAK